MIVIMAFLLAIVHWIAMTFVADRELRGWLAFFTALIFLCVVIAVVYYPGSCNPLQINITTGLTTTAPQ